MNLLKKNNKLQKMLGSIQRKPSKSVGIKEDVSASWPSRQALCKLMESRGADTILKVFFGFFFGIFE